MTQPCAYIAAMGIVSPLGCGVETTVTSILDQVSGLSCPDVFPAALNSPLVGQVREPVGNALPRTHELAHMAANEAMGAYPCVPDAIVLGVTTGGMLKGESYLKAGQTDSGYYRYHALGSVADHIAGLYGCTGPVITVSTACSSGNAALVIALELIRSGRAGIVLAGGADSLCRMTYHGFKSLQVVDPLGARPFDRMRNGMTVAEGAAMLILTSRKPDCAIAELSGGGLTCDAFHASSPHPEGEGAFNAMAMALADSGVQSRDIDYISLHGTGTLANDQAEALAVNRLFAGNLPPASSVKGAMGHTLGAAGAIEAVISAIAVSRGLIPANVGFAHPDPELKLVPVTRPIRVLPIPPAGKPGTGFTSNPGKGSIRRVLSNGFGFGGNNASVVVSAVGSGDRASGRPAGQPSGKENEIRGDMAMTVIGQACVTGAGATGRALDSFYAGSSLAGTITDSDLVGLLSLRRVRRLKRLSRIMLALAVQARDDAGSHVLVSSVFGGTGWGSLSETWDFLSRLFATGETVSSPIDFVGSVHNAALGQVAMELGAHGPNITTTGGDCSFEQALWTAGLMGHRTGNPFMVMGGDEYHEELSPRFDLSVKDGEHGSDGGGALVLLPGRQPGRVYVNPLIFRSNPSLTGTEPVLADCIETLSGNTHGYGAVLAGIPGSVSDKDRSCLLQMLGRIFLEGPVIDYRNMIGEFASASAVATVLAVDGVARQQLPDPENTGRLLDLNGRGVLMLGFGRHFTAVEVMPG